MDSGVIRHKTWYRRVGDQVFLYDLYRRRFAVTTFDEFEADPTQPLEDASGSAGPSGSRTKRHRIGRLQLSHHGACSRDCTYCFHHPRPNAVCRSSVLFDALDLFVSEIGADLDELEVTVALGKEPLADPDLINRLLGHANAIEQESGRTIRFVLRTEGGAPFEKARKSLEVLRDKGGSVQLRLDGPELVHDRSNVLGRGRVPYRQAVAFLHSAKDLGVKVSAEAVISSEYPFPSRVLRHLLSIGFDEAGTRTVRSNRKADHLLERFRSGYDELFQLFRIAIEQDDFEQIGVLSGDESLRPMWRLLPIDRPRVGGGLHQIVVDGNGALFLCDRLIGSESRAVGSVSGGVDWMAVDHDPLVVERDPCSHCWARFACGSACRLTGIHRNYPAESLDRVACQLNEYLVEQNMELIAHTALRYGTLQPLISALIQDRGYNTYGPTIPPERTA